MFLKNGRQLMKRGFSLNSWNNGHRNTALDGKIYSTGMIGFKKMIADEINNLDFLNDPEATDKLEELKAMDISCDAVILFAERHAQLAEEKALKEENTQRKLELENIAKVCRRVPALLLRIYGKQFRCIGLYILEQSLN
jgi:hypothetical protein